jgi:molybdopterin molybdotransferase
VAGQGFIKQARQKIDFMTLNQTLKNATPHEARGAMLAGVSALGPEKIALHQGLGRMLAQDIIATRDQPPFAASAMDGYAVRAADTPGDFELVGESAAGTGFGGVLEQGQCVRIFTGAPLPVGADAVIIQEDVRVNGDMIAVPATSPNRHVRARGNDFTAGATLVSNGTKLDAIALALIAATGRDTITVSRKPIVAILSGGDEIVSPGATPEPFQIFDSITTGLTSLLKNWGVDVITFAPQRDTMEALKAGFEMALSKADLVVTVGGASVGDRDLMKPALGAFAPTFIVDKIAVRPGKPTWFATTQNGAVMGLPGNPASAIVCAHLFLKPVIAALLGGETKTDFSAAKLSRALPPNGPREHYLRAIAAIDDTGQVLIAPLEDQDSALLSVFQAANALIRCLPNSSERGVGEIVTFLDLKRSH